MKFYQYIVLIITLIFLNACATFKPQYKDENYVKTFPSEIIRIEHIKYSFVSKL